MGSVPFMGAQRVEANGLSFNVVVEGPENGRPVILLHGWPDSSELWRHQIPALADAGFRVIAPDLRGFGESDKPADKDLYGLLYLLGDVTGILDALAIDKAAVIGHDWGAALAWVVGAFTPERVEKLVALSVGHPAAFGAAGLEQREKSWYMLAFQFEGIAEQWLTMDDFANFRAFSRGSYPDFDATTAQWKADPARVTAGLNWYRANVGPESLVSGPPPVPPVTVPTMGVWSSGDMALTEISMSGSSAFVTGPWRYERLEGPGHWMQLEEPDRVNALLLDFLE